MNAEIKDLVRQSPFFDGVSDRTLEEIVRIARKETFDEGDRVYELGDDANDVYLVVSGRVRFSMGVGNRAGTDSIMGPRQAFGWAALIDERPRRVATAVCLEASTICVIPARGLLELFDKDRVSGYPVMRRLAGQITRDLLSVLAV